VGGAGAAPSRIGDNPEAHVWGCSPGGEINRLCETRYLVAGSSCGVRPSQGRALACNLRFELSLLGLNVFFKGMRGDIPIGTAPPSPRSRANGPKIDSVNYVQGGPGAFHCPALGRPLLRSISALNSGNENKLMDARRAKRVVFERGHAATIMAIDGTWGRPCVMLDVSDTGARLSIEGSIEGLQMSEFFLVLSSVGKAYRRCQLAWVNGNQVGVDFLKLGTNTKQKPRGTVSET